MRRLARLLPAGLWALLALLPAAGLPFHPQAALSGGGIDGLLESAVIDRIVDGAHAVLLIGEAQTERVVPAADLPEGAAEGDWLLVRFSGGRLLEARLDPAKTEDARRRIEAKLDRLRARGRPGPKE